MTFRHLRLAFSLAAAVTALAVLAVTAAARPASTHTLIGVTGKNNAFVITLKTTTGKLVKTLPPGTYTFVIHDDSAMHNYELDGPHGKSWTFTGVGFTGTKTFTLKLVAGAYKAYCKIHEPTMFQRFTVT